MKRTAAKQTEAEQMVEQMVALARGLSPERLQSALDFMRFLLDEQHDAEWEPDEESRGDLAAAEAGDLTRFRSHDQVWGDRGE